MSVKQSLNSSPTPGLAGSILPEWPARPHRQETCLVGVLPGEGIGPEVIAASLALLRTITAHTRYRFEVRTGGKIGLEAQRESGRTLTPQVMGFCEEIFAGGGALLCGPGGGRFVYELRAQFDLFCKLVPLVPLASLGHAGVLRAEARRDVDMLVVRENAGGLYLGEFGTEATPGGVRAWHRFHYDERQVARILRVAIAAARARRGRLCVVTKPAGIPDISALWERTARALVADSGVALRILEVDTACYQVLAEAQRFDVIAAPNMFGDVLADVAGILLGSRGVTFSANFSPRGCAVYQTGHGAAYDLAGADEANPVGQMQSLAMMLAETFGLPEIAVQVIDAINDTLTAGWRTPDLLEPGCRRVGTAQFAERVAAALAARLAPVESAAAAGGSE